MAGTNRLPPGAYHELELLFDPEQWSTDPRTLASYSQDDTPRSVQPAAVIFPHTTSEVAAIITTADRHQVPVVGRGAGSGNVGGALPSPGAIVVAFEAMAAILEMDPANRLMRVQPGVTNQAVQEVAAEYDLFWPPDPGSAAYCQVGANIAMNSAGPGALKRGVTRDWVLALEAVIGTGEVLRTGVRTTKGVVGYDLTRLLIGSEGTLGLVTEVTLQLCPRPPAKRTARACFDSVATACAAVERVMGQTEIPSALEFMDRLALEALRQDGAEIDLPAGTQALLIAEADGVESALEEGFTQICKALEGEGLVQLKTATSPQERAALWQVRQSLSGAVKRLAPLKINEDVVVPRTQVRKLIARLEELAQLYRLRIANFGHIGDGNIHINLLVDPEDLEEMAQARACLSRIFDSVLELGGTLSGEHGVGSEKVAFVARELGGVARDLHRRLKEAFDPDGILNPGKAF